jgi:hypothetical protein
MSIPRIFHRIWIGAKPLHPRMVEYQKALINLHYPQWIFKTWHGDGQSPDLICAEDGTCFRSNNTYLLQQALHLAQQSNILRLELLLAFGGVYIDMDLEPLKPLDSIIENCSACISPFFMDPIRCNNSFLACTPQHPWIQDCLKTLPERDPKVPLSMGSSHVTAALVNHPEVSILNKYLILQMPAWEVLRSIGRRPDPRTYAIHHFSSAWYPTGFEIVNVDGSVTTKTGRF